MSSLDFRYTCSEIDQAIESVKNDCRSTIDHHFPSRSEDEREEMLQVLIQDITPYFETIRSLNEQMRAQAEYQINNLTTNVEELECQIKELESNTE